MTNQVSMLTISNSLARELRHQHNEERNLLHEKVWASPDIIPWSAWLKRCYQSLIDEGLSDFLLLDEHQERLVWEKIIISDIKGEYTILAKWPGVSEGLKPVPLAMAIAM